MNQLGRWLESKELTQKQFAERIGADQGQVSRILSGERLPGLGLAIAIEKATEGAVPASGWVRQATTRAGRRTSRAS